jgi:ABC-2 type transport system permease protein
MTAMLWTVIRKSLRDQRRALAGWAIGIASMVGLMALVWPSFRDMPDLEQFLANYPKEMRELFNIESMTTGTGYLNAELYSMLLPILFIIFAIGRGARAIASEEEHGTLDVLLVTPVSPARLVAAQAITLAAVVSGLGAVLFATTLAASSAAGMGVSVADAATGTLAMMLLGLEFGWLALAVGAMTGRRAWAIGVSSIVAVAAYLLYLLGEMVDAVRPWRPISPFQQALDGGPLGAGLPLEFIWLVLPAVLVVVAAMPVFDRRDIAAR